MTHWTVKVVAVVMACAGHGCTFVGISALNLGPFFSSPAAAPRHDLPSTRDAALSVLWVGHATALIQIHDKYILTDPVFTERVGTFSRRLVQPGLAVDDVPPIDVVLISHRHFDHLSRDSLELIAPKIKTVLTPEGAGEDVPDAAYETYEVATDATWEEGGLEITAVSVLHDGARLMFDGDSHARAFTGYVIRYRGTTVFFPGDTAFDESIFTRVHERFGDIDLAVLPIGPITPTDIMLEHHMDPAQALRAMDLLGAKAMVPVHFATFVNSYDDEGECEAVFDHAVEARRLYGRSRRLEIGERWVVVSAYRAGQADATRNELE